MARFAFDKPNLQKTLTYLNENRVCETKATPSRCRCCGIWSFGVFRKSHWRGNGIEYERCALPYVPIIDLPSPAKEEANAAIENEVYETDGKLVLSEVISTDESYLIESRERGWRYYDLTVTTDDGVTRLHGEEIRPKETSLPTVENKMETDVTVDIRVEFEDEVVFEDTLTFAAGTETDLDEGTAYRYGHYQATLTISTGTEPREEVVTWTNNHVHGTKGIAISADDVRTIGAG